ncbi:MAG: FAD-dependent oxidoreductase, partial [candidate division Zixibacteria bacterium]
AYYLRASGHQVDIFDQDFEPGGMLRYGIPDYRLPPDVLNRELEILKKMGVNFHLNTKIDSEFGIPELKGQGYNVILLAAGIPISKSLLVENSNLDGILPGLEYLRSAKGNQKSNLKGRIVVIGGGNVAIDSAMTAFRLGAEQVRLVCLESREEMPAHDWEIAQAEEEGVIINPSWGPKRFISDKGRLSGVELKRCIRVFDEQARFDPQYNEDETDHIPADFVIITIGQEADRELLQHVDALGKESKTLLKVDKDFRIGIEGVFGAGDIIRGPSSVVEAISDGRESAEVIDRYLGGNGLSEIIHDLGLVDQPRLDASSDSIQRRRQAVKTADPGKRKLGFGLIDETYEDQAARFEAQRCLQCHLRQLITPDILPPELWLPLNNETVESIPTTEGVFQLSNGEKEIIRICGSANLRDGLTECLDNPGDARYFNWEEDPMFTKRESELIQQYLQEHGKLPSGNDLDDELF